MRSDHWVTILFIQVTCHLFCCCHSLFLVFTCVNFRTIDFVRIDYFRAIFSLFHLFTFTSSNFISPFIFAQGFKLTNYAASWVITAKFCSPSRLHWVQWQYWLVVPIGHELSQPKPMPSYFNHCYCWVNCCIC